MDRNTVIKLKKQISVTDLSGEKVMIDFDSGKYYILKGVGNDIWDYIQNTITVGEIIDKLMEEYEVTEEQCSSSVISFLSKLKEINFID